MLNKKGWFKDIDELMVLACLSQKSCCCSEIVEFINSYRDDEHKTDHNTVFNALYFLRDRKAIEGQSACVAEEKERVCYNLLPGGKRYFEEFLRDYRAYISSAKDVLENSTKLNETNPIV